MLRRAGVACHQLDLLRWQFLSLEKPRLRVRFRGFSLGGVACGLCAPLAEVGVQVGAMVANAPPNANERRALVAVPPLGEFFHAAQHAQFGVFGEEDTVLVKDISQLFCLAFNCM